MSFVNVTNPTPFGIFDADADFANDADKLLTWVKRKLGDPVIDVELSSSHIYQSFEEAAIEYSAITNQYQAKSALASFLGSATGSLSGSENKYPHSLWEFTRRQAEKFAEEARVGGNYTLHSSSFTTTIGKQTYDLNSLLTGVVATGSQGQNKRVVIDKIFHFSPTTAYRFFGTTSAINFLNNSFSFESFTPETIFYLLPIWEDILRGQQFETSNRVRRSQYSYEVRNMELRLFPSPVSTNRIHFTYRIIDRDPTNPDFVDDTVDGVANLSNVPFGHIQYSKLNSISKQWIWKMTYALSQELLGEIRSKISTIPIPDGDLTLNGSDLISDARAEMGELRNYLRELFEDMTYEKISEREAKMAEDLHETLKMVPLGIYVGSLILFFFNEHIMNMIMGQ